MFAQTKIQIDEYVKGKTWYWYLPLWFFGWYVFIALLGFDPNKQMPFVINIAQAFDFFLHEMAHIITAFLPSILTAASGSLSEIFLGAALIFTAFKTKGYFSVMITSLWFMLACQSAGVYMADARAQKLALVSLGGALSGTDTVIHDWHFVFGKLHILGLDIIIGDTVRAIGILAGLAGIAFTAWLLYRMAGAGEAAVIPMSAREKELVQITALKSHVDNPTEQRSEPVKQKGMYPEVSKGPLADSTLGPTGHDVSAPPKNQ